MRNTGIILGGKFLSQLSKTLNLGHGSTWPGHIALTLNKGFIQNILRNSPTKIVFIVGTNGKTTTTSLIKHLLEESGKKVIQNSSGANLLNGIASTLLLHSSITGKLAADYVLFEVDENTLPQALRVVTPDAVILLNLFRDQLDRYGEVNTIARKWQEALKKLPSHIQIIANADDPQIAFIGKSTSDKTIYFGLDEANSTQKTHEHAVDSTYCPTCGQSLTYTSIFYSHLGIWHCTNCKLKRPDVKPLFKLKSVLTGTYNMYNIQAAILLATFFGITSDEITRSVASFTPAFGRQEKVSYKGKRVEIILAKNPTGFNESLRTIQSLRCKNLLLVLNDRVADGHDVSWIWDVDFDLAEKTENITLSGDRAYDLGLRLHYEDRKDYTVEENLEKALAIALSTTPSNDTLFILPTYTAMLEVRKLITGKKIL